MASLDTPEDQDAVDIGADLALGFVPVVGTAQAGRDFERARRDNDKLGMVLSAAAGIPVVGGVAKAANKGRKAKNTVEALRAPRAQALETARLNAVKMLGLPESNTATDRAKALGATGTMPVEMISGPGKQLLSAHALGKKVKEIDPSFEEWAHGAYSKELGPWPWDTPKSDVWESFFDAGNLGHEPPKLAHGWRLGNIPASGRSWNHRDNIPEKGVSMAFVDHPQGGNWEDLISRKFIEAQGRPKVDVGGYLVPHAVGSDGEPLLVAARKIQGDYTLSSGKQRSRHAVFDPARVNENDLLGRADPRLLAAIAAGGLGTSAAVAALRNRKKDDEEEQ